MISSTLFRSIWSIFYLAAVFLPCSSCTEDETPIECICDEGSCPEEVCNLGFELPVACTFASADVAIDGEQVGSASPGTPFSTCRDVISEGDTVTVQISAASFEPTETVATCTTGGASVAPEYCTLLFKLGESCRGLADTATVVVDRVDMGETAVDRPLVPCLLLAPGEEVQGTIRAGTTWVLTTPIRCNDAGTQPSLTMECS